MTKMQLFTKFESGLYIGEQLNDVMIKDLAYVQVALRLRQIELDPKALNFYNAICLQPRVQNQNLDRTK
jgi:hypothetical protein